MSHHSWLCEQTDRHSQPASIKTVIGLSSSAADRDAPVSALAGAPRRWLVLWALPTSGWRCRKTSTHGSRHSSTTAGPATQPHDQALHRCVLCWGLGVVCASHRRCRVCALLLQLACTAAHPAVCLSCRVSRCCCRCGQVLDSLKALKELPYTPAPHPASGPEASVAAGGGGGGEGSSGAAADRPAAAGGGGGSGAGGEEGSMQRVDSTASAGVTDTSGPLASLDSPSAAAAATTN